MATVRIVASYIERVEDDVELDIETGIFYRVAFDEQGKELSREQMD